jgi:molecular chaperone DnaK (HSP70)
MKSNFRNTVNYFTRFLGIQGKPSFYQQETKWLTVANELDNVGKTNFEVSYQGAKCKFTPEQLTASMLNKLKEIIYKNNVNFSSCNCVLSVTILQLL